MKLTLLQNVPPDTCTQWSSWVPQVADVTTPPVYVCQEEASTQMLIGVLAISCIMFDSSLAALEMVCVDTIFTASFDLLDVQVRWDNLD